MTALALPGECEEIRLVRHAPGAVLIERGRRRVPRLSPRQAECLVLAAHGMTNGQIAAAMAITPQTVARYLIEAHAAAVYAAFGITARHRAATGRGALWAIGAGRGDE